MTGKWTGKKVQYNERLGAFYFDTEEQMGEALYVVDIPDNTKSFSVSVKVGDSNDYSMKGYQDSGRITVGYGDGTEHGVTSRMTSAEKEFIIFTLGDEISPVSTNGADKIYIKSEGRNFDGGKLDFYFCEPTVSFYETESEVVISRDLSFRESHTGEKININGGAFDLKTVLTVSAAVLAIIIKLIRIKMRNGRRKKFLQEEGKMNDGKLE